MGLVIFWLGPHKIMLIKLCNTKAILIINYPVRASITSNNTIFGANTVAWWSRIITAIIVIMFGAKTVGRRTALAAISIMVSIKSTLTFTIKLFQTAWPAVWQAWGPCLPHRYRSGGAGPVRTSRWPLFCLPTFIRTGSWAWWAGVWFGVKVERVSVGVLK